MIGFPNIHQRGEWSSLLFQDRCFQSIEKLFDRPMSHFSETCPSYEEYRIIAKFLTTIIIVH